MKNHLKNEHLRL